MNEAEFFEFLNDSVTVANDNLMTFVTVFFAYMLCSYFVGQKLTLVQVIALTLAYTILSISSVLTLHYTLSRIGDLGAKYPQFYPNSDRAELFSYAMPSLIVFVWLMSVVFMVSEYRKGVHERLAV